MVLTCITADESNLNQYVRVNMQQQAVKHTKLNYTFGLKRRSMCFIILCRIAGELTEGTKDTLFVS